MLRLINNVNSSLNTDFYNFKIKKHLKIIFSSILLFILIMSCLSFYNEAKINYFKDRLKIIDQFLIKNGFRIKNIEIIGTQNLSRDYLKNIINKHNDVSIFNIELPLIYKNIVQNSWVKEGYIERVLPDTIKIKILEKKPVAIWQNKNGNQLVTLEGEIIANGNVNAFKNSFPIIRGHNAKENISSILKVLDTNKKLAKNIWSLSFINKRRWNLHFNQGLTVRLPSKDEFIAWEKIVKLQQDYNIVNLRLTEIDLRNPEQILGKINFDKKVVLKGKNL
tara:strand:- start:198 stop:1031 length:834 start_codon:yes stop_codon:yes gene_type:complete